MSYTKTTDEFTISTEKRKPAIGYIYNFLSHSTAAGIPVERVKKVVDGSLSFWNFL